MKSPNAVETVYLGCERPLLHSALEFLQIHWQPTLKDGQRRWDLSQLVLVLPTSTSRRRLSDLLEDYVQQHELTIQRPQLITVGKLPSRLFKTRLPIANEMEQTLAWTRALTITPDNELAALLSSLPPRDPLTPWIELASTLNALHADLAAGQLTFADVEKEVNGDAEKRRWRLLNQLYRQYLRELASAGRIDLFAATSEAIEQKTCATKKTIVLIGTTDLARSLTTLLRAVADRAQATPQSWPSFIALVAADERDRDHFDAFGSIIAKKWLTRELPLRDDQLISAQDVADQADSVAKVVQQWTGSVPVRQVTVGVTDESLVAPMEFELRTWGLESFRELGWTVTQTSIGRLLELLSDHLTRGTWRSLAALVRHADLFDFVTARLKDTADSTEQSKSHWLAQLDELISGHYPTLCDQPLPPRCNDLYDSAVAVRDTIQSSLRDLQGPPRTLSDWAGRLMAWLHAIYYASDGAPRFQLDTRHGRSIDSVFRFLEAVQVIERALDVKVTAASGIELLTARLAGIRVTDVDTLDSPLLMESVPDAQRPEGLRDRIRVLGWLDLALDDSSHMVVTSLNHPYVPEAITADPFLPGGLRARLQLNDNERRMARDIHALEVILCSRQEVRIVIGTRGMDGSPTPPSRLLAAAKPNDAVRRLRHLLDHEHGTPIVSASDSPTSVEAATGQSPWTALAASRTRSALPIPALPKDRAVQRMSVTAFKDFLTCPYRFFLRHVLFLRPLDDASGELQANQFGDLVHNTLDWFGKSALKDVSDVRELRAALHDKLDEYAADFFGSHPNTAVRLQIEQARQRLSAVAQAQCQRRLAGWYIHDVETPFGEAQQAAIWVDGLPMPIRGRIDRIDRNEDGRWAIIDYKTHRFPPREKHLQPVAGEMRWVDLQLPLYRLLIPFVIGEEIDVHAVSLSYFNIGEKQEDTKVNDADFSDEEMALAIKTIEDCVRRIRRGEFEPADNVMFDDYAMILQTGSLRAWLDLINFQDAEDEAGLLSVGMEA